MREQLKHLVGEITLRPIAEDYLEAELIGRYDGLFKLASNRRYKSRFTRNGVRNDFSAFIAWLTSLKPQSP